MMQRTLSAINKLHNLPGFQSLAQDSVVHMKPYSEMPLTIREIDIVYLSLHDQMTRVDIIIKIENRKCFRAIED